MRLDRIGYIVLVAAWLSGGCDKANYFECSDSASCDLHAGGMCVAGGTGSWCSYPDEECDSGYRYSNDDVGDSDLRGVCVPGMRRTLTVTLGGTGTGNVVSNPAGLTCSSRVCTGKFPDGAQVVLTATASTGAFLGWSGTCLGRGQCSLVMDTDRTTDAMFGVPGEAMWALQLTGPTAGELGQSVAIDRDKNLIVVGRFDQKIAPKVATAATTLTANGAGSDAFVFKVDGRDGTVIWAKRFGGAFLDVANAVAVDASNNIYIAGAVTGPLDFGAGNVVTTGLDPVILKLGPDGAFGWARVLSGSGDESANAIAVDADSVVVTGGFSGSMTVDGATSNTAGGADIFVMSVSPTDGAKQWFKNYGGTSVDVPRAVSIDSKGSVIVTGTFRNSISFGGSALTAPSTNNAMFIAKLAPTDGAHQTSLRAGGDGFTAGNALGTDASDNFYVAGDFSGTSDFRCASSLTSSSPPRADLFLAKYSQAGACLSVRQFGSSSAMDLSVFSLSLDAEGGPAITGTFSGTLNLGGSPLAAAGNSPDTDLFAARFNSVGEPLNSVRAGGAGREFASSVAHAPDGTFYVTGNFSGFSEFGDTAFTADGGQDAFLVGFYPL